MKKAIIFGVENFAKMLYQYLQDINVDVEAFCVDDEYYKDNLFCEKEVVPFSKIKERFSSEKFDAYVAVGYTNMGHLRQQIFEKLHSLGYSTPNFIHPTANVSNRSVIAQSGNIIMENAIIGTMATIGEGNIIWPGANIGHNAVIGNWNTLSLNSVFCGFSRVENFCFCGANSCVRDECVVANETLIGANVFISHNTEQGQAFAAGRPYLLKQNSLDVKL